MGEFICVCAIYMCEIKAAEVSVCSTRTTGLGSPPLTYLKKGRKWMQEKHSGLMALGDISSEQRWGSGKGMQNGGCVLRPVLAGGLRCPRTGESPDAYSSVTLYFCMFLFMSYINLLFHPMEWDFGEVWNDKTQLCFPAGFPVCTRLWCLTRLPAPSTYPTEPGAKLEQNTQRIQFTNRNKHLFSRFYIITKQNQGRGKKKRTTQHFLSRWCAAVTLYFLEEITLLPKDV